MSDDPNKLCGEFKAEVWVEEWLKTIEEHPDIPTDGETMIGWFSNAIMAGYDKAAGERESDIELLKKALRLAAGELSTYGDNQSKHPEEVYDKLLADAEKLEEEDKSKEEEKDG